MFEYSDTQSTCPSNNQIGIIQMRQSRISSIRRNSVKKLGSIIQYKIKLQREQKYLKSLTKPVFKKKDNLNKQWKKQINQFIKNQAKFQKIQIKKENSNQTIIKNLSQKMQKKIEQKFAQLQEKFEKKLAQNIGMMKEFVVEKNQEMERRINKKIERQRKYNNERQQHQEFRRYLSDF